MQPITRPFLERQDLPILLLAWLLPATFLLLAPAYQIWPGVWFSHANPVEPSGTWTHQVWPLTLLLAFVAAVACCALQMIGKRGMLIALSFCSVFVIVLALFSPGRPSNGAFQLVLLMGLMAFSVYSRKHAKLGIGAGLCASALLAIGPQTVPFAALAMVWFAGDWAADRGEDGGTINRKTIYFGYSIASGTIILSISSLPDWASGSFSCGPLSMAHTAPTVLAGLGLAHLARTTTEFAALQQRLACIAFVGLIALSGSVAANPTCLVSATSAVEALWAHKFGLLNLLNSNPRSAYILLATPMIGVASAGFAVLKNDGPYGTDRAAWALMLGSLLTAILVLFVDVRLAIYANALAIIPCAYFVLTVGRFTQMGRPTSFAGVLFIVVWLSGMNLTHVGVAKYVLPGSSEGSSQSALTPQRSRF